MNAVIACARALVVVASLTGCAMPCREGDPRIPSSVVRQFRSAPAFEEPLAGTADISFAEFTRRKEAGDVVESVAQGGYVYFLVHVPWSWPLENGDGHVDGMIVDGVYRARIDQNAGQRTEGGR